MDRNAGPARTGLRPPLGPPPVARCANCDITLSAEQIERDGRLYCCEGCAIGGPCIC